MAKKVVGIVGSYRKRKVIDSAVEEALKGAITKGLLFMLTGCCIAAMRTSTPWDWCRFHPRRSI